MKTITERLEFWNGLSFGLIFGGMGFLLSSLLATRFPDNLWHLLPEGMVLIFFILSIAQRLSLRRAALAVRQN